MQYISSINRGAAGRTLLHVMLFSLLITGCGRFQKGAGAYKPFAIYRLSVEDPGLKIVRVDGELHGALDSETALVQFSGVETHKVDPIRFAAADFDGRPLEVVTVDNGFRVRNRGRDFQFSYSVSLIIEDMYSPDIRTMLTMIDENRYRLLAREVLLVPEREISDGVIIDFSIPADWRLLSTSPSVNRRTIVNSVAEMRVASFVCGDFQCETTRIDDTELSVAAIGKWKFDVEDFFDAVKRIVSYEIYLFGDSPRRKYIVVCERNPVKYGKGFDYYGIHIGGAIFLFLDPGMDKSSLFDIPMSIISHEAFHSWNGDALKPESDDFLWFVEGATVYYSYRVLLDTGIITREQFARRRSMILRRFMDNPYHGEIPIRRAANSNLGDKDLVNFLYDGGYLVSEALDGIIKERTGGEFSLIDVLRYLYRERGKYEYFNRERLICAIRELTGEDISSDLHRLVDEESVQFSMALPYSLD